LLNQPGLEMKFIIKISVFVLVISSLNLFYSCKKDKPSAPSLTTSAVSEISYATATSGGNITNDGGAAVTSQGICWNATADPTIENTKTTESAGSTSFTSSLTQLNAGTKYYVRAYATNSAGTGYGESVSFITLGDKPSVTAVTPSGITLSSATLNGSVISNSLSTAVTFEWGTTTSYGTSVTPAQSPVSGSTSVAVNADLTGLTIGTVYHFRIKVENSLGITYSSDMTFTTLGQVPSVATLDASNLSVSTAKLNGSVNPNYLRSAIHFEWGTTYGYGNTITPVLDSVNGSTTVNVSADLSGLTEGTKYCFRIVATNSLGTTNGIGFTFTTQAKPQITTKDISGITTTSALSGGNITNDFGSHVTESGICWSTSHSPTTSDNKVLNSSGAANFSAPIASLTPNSTYYLRAYAINGVGTGYGKELILKTYTGTISDIDGNQYHTVTIGTQLWMAENLKTTKYQNGALIGTTTPAQLNITGESTPKYQWAAGADENNVATYGRYYTWYAITDARNVCPLGWHIPTTAEWNILSSYLGPDSIVGSKLKEAGLLHFSSLNSDATNESGFTALPAGYRNQEGYYGGIYEQTGFWTFTQFSSTEAYSVNVDAGSPYIGRYSHFTLNFGFSVRCTKD
jgi:uncharacterized protein (TIGR02145 family)